MLGRIRASVRRRLSGGGELAPQRAPVQPIEHRADGRPVKVIEVRGTSFKVAGLTEDDTYFNSLTRQFEPDFLSLCERLLAADSICLDIGANIGVKALALSQFDPEGRIVAVEAGPGIVPLLRSNTIGVANIAVCHAAIGDRDGSVRFHESSAYGHISGAGGVAVPAKTLATLVEDFALPRVDFIKIDVEGFEFPILRSSLDLINRNRALVLLEFNSWCQLALAETSPMDLARWLLSSFSHVFLVRRDEPAGGHLRRCRSTDAQALLHTNLIEDRCVTDILVTNAPDRLPGNLQ